MGRILIVSREPNAHKILACSLEQDRHVVLHSSGMQEAKEAMARNRFDAILTEQRMADGGGLDVLAAALDADPTISVILSCASASAELAAESVRKGAFDCLVPPVAPEALRAAINRACNHTTLLRENGLLKATIGQLDESPGIFGDTPMMREVREKILHVVPTSAPVLVTGEAGTGKELVARIIHRQGPRAHKAFLAVNCAAFTDASLEGELFGYERGAFTGAEQSRPGLFEAAHEGAIFLDEIAEMSSAAQAKLHRVLTDGQVMRIGSVQTRTVDVRVLAATQRDLQEQVKQGLFREDLYHLLSAVLIPISPLRERPDDIASLCELFLRQTARELKVPRHRLSPGALARLQSYEFPGNIRELRNLIERAVILSAGEEIGPEHFPLMRGAAAASGNGHSPANMGWMETLPPSFDLRNLLSTVEKTLIERTLQSTNGAQAEAARRLGLSRSDLSYKLLKYELRKASTPS